MSEKREAELSTQAHGNARAQKFKVDIAEPTRLDVYVTELMGRELGQLALSRSQLKKEIEAGKVKFAGKTIQSPGVKISGAGVLEFFAYEPVELEYQPDSEIAVIFEDADLIVLNKPAGLSVHPGAGRRDATLVNKLLPKLASTDRIRPGIVHRLDKDTTGLLVVAKTVQAHASLAEQFAQHSMERRYQALVLATPRSGRPVMEQESGTITASLLRVEKKIVVDPSGRRAVTHWKVIERLGYGAELEFRLETGRTHQIRVHAAKIKSPVIGDRTYGDFSGLPAALFRVHHAFGRQALHAFSLGFIHPTSKKELSFSVPPPPDYVELVKKFRAFGAGPITSVRGAATAEDVEE